MELLREKNVFGEDFVRRHTLCIVRNRCFRETTTASTSFRYKKFHLHRMELLQGTVLDIAGTPLDSLNDTRLYYNTITTLGFDRSGNRMALKKYRTNHFHLVFKLTSTKEGIKRLILFAKMIRAGIILKLSFSKALQEAVDIVLIGKQFSQFFIDNSIFLSKKVIVQQWILSRLPV